jgi:hypothetical protein
MGLTDEKATIIKTRILSLTETRQVTCLGLDVKSIYSAIAHPKSKLVDI